jgi:predicted nucleic acid-binding protein
MTYCDSSFIVSLYVPTDVFNRSARKEAAKFTEAIPDTLLNELEFMNAIRRGLGDGAIDPTDHDAIVREGDEDEASGLLERISLNQVKLHERALELSKKYTPTFARRSLDIRHVASAIVLGRRRFASFDLRQRKLAEAVGLTLVPTALPKVASMRADKS